MTAHDDQGQWVGLVVAPDPAADLHGKVIASRYASLELLHHKRRPLSAFTGAEGDSYPVDVERIVLKYHVVTLGDRHFQVWAADATQDPETAVLALIDAHPDTVRSIEVTPK